MANFKRGRRKDARAGCLMCKPHKGNGCKGSAAAKTTADRRRDDRERDSRRDAQEDR